MNVDVYFRDASVEMADEQSSKPKLDLKAATNKVNAEALRQYHIDAAGGNQFNFIVFSCNQVIIKPFPHTEEKKRLAEAEAAKAAAEGKTVEGADAGTEGGADTAGATSEDPTAGGAAVEETAERVPTPPKTPKPSTSRPASSRSVKSPAAPAGDGGDGDPGTRSQTHKLIPSQNHCVCFLFSVLCMLFSCYKSLLYACSVFSSVSFYFAVQSLHGSFLELDFSVTAWTD